MGAAAKSAAAPPPPPLPVRAASTQLPPTHQSPDCPRTPTSARADTTIGLILTIGLHKAALRGAGWYGERYGQRYGGSGALEPVACGAANPAHERWFEAMQLCGNYGGWLLLLPLLVVAPAPCVWRVWGQRSSTRSLPLLAGLCSSIPASLTCWLGCCPGAACRRAAVVPPLGHPAGGVGGLRDCRQGSVWHPGGADGRLAYTCGTGGNQAGSRLSLGSSLSPLPGCHSAYCLDVQHASPSCGLPQDD